MGGEMGEGRERGEWRERGEGREKGQGRGGEREDESQVSCNPLEVTWIS